MDWVEACRILGVSESAVETEIKEQYYYKAQLLHPDKNLDKPENIRKKAEAELAVINQAYTYLNNPNNNPYRSPPKLQVEPSGVRFKDVKMGEKKYTSLTVKNVGGPYTSIWIDNQPAPWLAVSEVKSITSERLPLEVTLECTGSGTPGTRQNCDLLIKLENEKTNTVDAATVKVELRTTSKMGSAQDRLKPPVAVAEPAAGDKPKHGFSPATLLVDLFGFAALGAILYFMMNIFFSISLPVLTISIIVYTAIAVGFSVNHGIIAGVKTEKIKSTGKKH